MAKYIVKSVVITGKNDNTSVCTDDMNESIKVDTSTAIMLQDADRNYHCACGSYVYSVGKINN